MSKPIHVKIRWDKALALKSTKLYYDWDMKHSYKRYVGWLFVAFVQFGIVGALKHNSFGLLFLSTFLVLYWYWGRWILRKKMIERFYDKNLDKVREIECTIDASGIVFAQQKLSWEEIDKVIPFDDGFVVQNGQNILYIPLESFDSKADIEKLKQYAEKNHKFINE